MTESLIWQTLGMEPTQDIGKIRRAYATRLKVTDAETDPEGFQRLRSAYEKALALAGRPQISVAAPPAPVSAPVSEPRASSPPRPQVTARPDPRPAIDQANAAAEVAAVRASLEALRMALEPNSTASEAELKQLLELAIETAARGSLTLQQSAESFIAQSMLATSPRSDVLLEECVCRYGWEKQETDLSPNRAILALLARRRDIATLAELKSRQDGLGIGYRRLTHPPQRWLRWWRANFFELGHWPEWAVLQMLKDRNPNLLRELDVAQIHWWDRFMSRPQFSNGLVRIGGKLTVLFTIMLLISAFLIPEPWYHSVLMAAGLITLYAAALAMRLYVIDWPILHVLRRWHGRPPWAVQVGWLPGLIVVLGTTTLLPENPGLWWIPGLLGVLGCLWAVYVSGPMPSVYQNRSFVLANSHVAMAVITNTALGLWWFLSASEFTRPFGPAPFGTRSAAAISLMAASGCGIRVLGKVWMERLDEHRRKRFTLGLVVLALALTPLVWLGGAYLALRPFIVGTVVAFVVIHRFACVNFSLEQLRLRAVVLIVAAIAGISLASGVASSFTAPIIQIGGLILLGVAVLSLLIARHNQAERGY
jgi:hypothetical protein